MITVLALDGKKYMFSSKFPVKVGCTVAWMAASKIAGWKR
jgi:GTP-dependent phosphoenolpyruvate carboxykinase